MARPAAAQDATWNLNGNGDYLKGANWSTGTRPTGTARFGVSNQSTVSIGPGTTSVGGWVFDAGAQPYVFNFLPGVMGTPRNFTFTGAGIQTNGVDVRLTSIQGPLTFQGSSTLGTAKLHVEDYGDVSFRSNANAGSGTISNANDGSIAFFDTSSAANATILASSSASFLDQSTAANATIYVLGTTISFLGSSSAGNAVIDNSGIVFFQDQASGGMARYIGRAGSSLDLTFLSNPGTTIGSIEGTGVITLGASNLAVGSNNLSTTFSGSINDGSNPFTGGSLTKIGTGTLTLTGANTYTGATAVNGGTLAVNGSITASSGVTVNSGGTLGGTGIVREVYVDGGVLSPGSNGIGTLNVQGDVVFTAAARYLVEVSATTSDRTIASDGGGLAGTVRVSSPTNSYKFKSPYTILTGLGGLSGTFDALATPAGIAGVLGYGSNDVFLTLTSALGSIPGLGDNQRKIANIFDAKFNGDGNTGAYGGIFAGNPAVNLTQATGQGAAATQTATFDAMGQFVGTMTDPFNAERSDGAAGGASGYAPDDAMAYAKAPAKPETTPFARVFTKVPPRNDLTDPRWNVWASGFGGSQTTDGVAAVGSNNTTSSIYGVAAGADYRFSPNTIAGFALAGGGTNFRTANLGSGRSDLFQAGGFIRHNAGAAYITAAAAYGWQDVTTDRTVTIAGVDRLRANFNSNALTGRVESGYRFVAPTFGGIGLTPYAAGQTTTVFLPSYAEQVIAGANTFALAFASRDVTATRSELGLRADKSFVMDTAILTLRGRAAWAHNFNPNRSINATFQSLPGASFTVNGAAAARDTALTSASAELRWLNGWSVAGTFEGEFSDRSRSYAGKGVVRYAW